MKCHIRPETKLNSIYFFALLVHICVHSDDTDTYVLYETALSYYVLESNKFLETLFFSVFTVYFPRVLLKPSRQK